MVSMVKTDKISGKTQTNATKENDLSLEFPAA
jgi:hypothetical protein